MKAPRTDDSGAVVTELVLILPLLVLLVLGLADFGFLWRQVSVITSATSSAGRVVSSTGGFRYADYEALRAVDGALSDAGRMNVDRVIIYQPGGGGSVPEECLAIQPTPTSTAPAGVSGVCNVYSAAQVSESDPGGFGSPSLDDPACSPGSWDENWCPTTRVAPTPGVDPDDIGVRVDVSYTPLTGVLGVSEFEFSRESVYQVEPCVDGLSLYDCQIDTGD